MSHPYVKNHIHLVFSTKGRLKMIPKDIQPELWAYMAGICRNHGLVPIAINGTDDHCHVLFHLPPTMEASKAVQVIRLIRRGGCPSARKDSRGRSAVVFLE